MGQFLESCFLVSKNQLVTLVCRINVQQNLLIFRIFPSYMSLFGATCLLIVSIKSYLHDYLDLQDFPTEALFFIECMLAWSTFIFGTNKYEDWRPRSHLKVAQLGMKCRDQDLFAFSQFQITLLPCGHCIAIMIFLPTQLFRPTHLLNFLKNP